MSVLFIKLLLISLIVTSVSFIGIAIVSKNKKENEKYKAQIIKLNKKTDFDLSFLFHINEDPNGLFVFGLGFGLVCLAGLLLILK